MPEPYQWVDVKDWYIKWGVLYLFFEDGTQHTEEINFAELDQDSIDWKRPTNTEIFPYDEPSGEVDYETEIDSDF